MPARDRQAQDPYSRQRLLENEERLRLATSATGLGTWEHEVATGKRVWSAQVRQVLGIPENAEPTLELLIGLIHPEDEPAATARYRAAFDPATGGEYHNEFRIRRASDGEERWIALRGRVLFDADGRPQRALGILLDVTGRKRAEQELRRLNETLEQRVAERTAELAAANRKLSAQIEERERAEAALVEARKLEAVGQLTSGIAHDFNNLLTVILGSIELMESAPGDAAQNLRRLARMRLAAERAARLTSQLLAFGRAQRLAPRPVDLNATLSGMRELLRSTVGEGIAVELHLHDGLWPAMAEPAQVELVIMNLVLNARDAMRGRGTVAIGTENAARDAPARPEEPPAGEHVLVSVTDTGAGMTPAVLARAFEPFFTTKPAGQGSGLGLSQVYGIVRQSGGGVRIESRPGEGTRIEVYLPRAVRDAERG